MILFRAWLWKEIKNMFFVKELYFLSVSNWVTKISEKNREKVYLR